MTRPIARQDSSPDIAHFVSGKFCDLNFDMTLGVCVCVCVGGGGGGGGGTALCKIFMKPKMNQISDKVMS